jgi:hypothetical protein
VARVTYVKSAKGRKDGRNRICAKCSTEIKPGDSYKWFANRIGTYSQRKNFCANCQVRPSDQTTSPHLQTIYLAQEAAEDALAKGDGLGLIDLAEIVRGFAEGVREASESYNESAENIEQGFGHETTQSEEIRDKASECESAADTLDSAADDIESLDDPDAEEDEFLSEYEGSVYDETGKPTDPEDFADWLEEKRQERREAAIEAANDAIAEGPQL